MGIVLYCIVAAMELGIFFSHLVWWFRLGRHEEKTIADEESQNADSDSEEECDNLEAVPTAVCENSDEKWKESEAGDLAAQKTIVID